MHLETFSEATKALAEVKGSYKSTCLFKLETTLSYMLLDPSILKILVPTSQQLLTLHICNAHFGDCIII